jgi:hypothetical protein
VSERQGRAEVETADRVVELSEVRKSLDSLNPPPPTGVPTAMVAMGDTDRQIPGATGSMLASPPTDADG